MGVDRLGFRQVFPTPRIAQQVLARHHLAGVLHQAGQELELARREVYLAVLARCRVGVFVQRDAAGRDGVVRAGEVAAGAAAQERADAGDELAHAERLGKVVVPADLQAHHLVELRVARRQEQHRHGGLGAQAATQLVAVHAGQHDIEHEQVVGVLRRQSQGLLAIVYHVGVETLLLQGVADEFRDGRLVVHDEDAVRCIVHVIPFYECVVR